MPFGREKGPIDGNKLNSNSDYKKDKYCVDCDNTGWVHEFGETVRCFCKKEFDLENLKSLSRKISETKRSEPPMADNQQSSAFNQNKNEGTQLDLFKDKDK